jgi:hypothetical protein
MLLLFVAIPAVVLFPVFSQARFQAQTTTCLSNVKQIGLAQMMYVSDYDERLPAASRWMTDSEPYIRNRNVYRCPTVAMTSPQGYGYAFNSRLSLKQLKHVKSPADTVMVYDSSSTAWNASDVATSMPKPGRHRTGAQFANSVGYVDGHAKLVPDGSPLGRATP